MELLFTVAVDAEENKMKAAVKRIFDDDALHVILLFSNLQPPIIM